LIEPLLKVNLSFYLFIPKGLFYPILFPLASPGQLLNLEGQQAPDKLQDLAQVGLQDSRPLIAPPVILSENRLEIFSFCKTNFWFFFFIFIRFLYKKFVV
jgi:hypothetical protein